jgi:CBS domain-containing protein
MEHQVDQLRRGEAPDNLIDPSGLAPLTRTSLKQAFRAVARIQRAVAQRLELAGW